MKLLFSLTSVADPGGGGGGGVGGGGGGRAGCFAICCFLLTFKKRLSGTLSDVEQFESRSGPTEC